MHTKGLIHEISQIRFSSYDKLHPATFAFSKALTEFSVLFTFFIPILIPTLLANFKFLR